jgi:hypothetical protein
MFLIFVSHFWGALHSKSVTVIPSIANLKQVYEPFAPKVEKERVPFL